MSNLSCSSAVPGDSTSSTLYILFRVAVHPSSLQCCLYLRSPVSVSSLSLQFSVSSLHSLQSSFTVSSLPSQSPVYLHMYPKELDWTGLDRTRSTFPWFSIPPCKSQLALVLIDSPATPWFIYTITLILKVSTWHLVGSVSLLDLSLPSALHPSSFFPPPSPSQNQGFASQSRRAGSRIFVDDGLISRIPTVFSLSTDLPTLPSSSSAHGPVPPLASAR